MAATVRPYGRVRVGRREAEALIALLNEERKRAIAQKIAARDAGEDTTEHRTHLALMKRIYEEVHRALNDIDETEDLWSTAGPEADAEGIS
jgi:hypothetical protein